MWDGEEHDFGFERLESLGRPPCGDAPVGH